MAETKDVLLKIQVSYKEAIDNIVKLGDQLEELRRKQKDLQKQTVIEGSEEQKARDAELEAVNAEIRLLSKAQREYRSEIDANLQAEEAQTGSLKEMRAQLKNLLREYDSLSQVDREEIGGVGEEKLLEIRRLQEELRQAEEASGRFQRSVGSYEDAIRKALDGTIPMKQAMRDLKVEIQTIQFQYVQMGSTIQQRTKDLDDLGKAVGTDTEEYKEQAAELEKLKAEYDATGQSLDQMKQAAGQMDDAMRDASASIKNFGADNANLKAMTQGAQVLLDGYTALKAGMTALGIESEELYNVFSKIEILQKGLNAVNQIANMLEKQSILSQQARVLWTKLTTTSIATLTAAKKKDAVASAEAAAGDTALAAGEVAATGAAGALTVALRAVGVAIKNIPVIGWILAAVAALGTLIGLIVKANKESKKGNDLIEQRKQLAAEINEIEKNVAEQTKKATVEMENNVRHLKEAKEGTEEWDTLIQQVADDLGVDAEWLKKNKDKVDKLKDAWIQLQIAMAKGQAYAQKMAENEIKLATLDADISRIISQNDYKDRADALAKELKISKQLVENIVKADHKLKKNNTAENYAAYANAINAARSSIEDNNEVMKKGIDDAYEEQKTAQAEMEEIAGDGIKRTNKKAVTASKAAAKDIKAAFKKLADEIEDMLVEGMAEGLEKDIAEVVKASNRFVEKMKEARDKDLENKEYYDKLILEKEKQTQAKVKKMRSDGYKEVLTTAKKLTESYTNLWMDTDGDGLFSFINQLKKVGAEINAQVEEYNKSVTQTFYRISDEDQTMIDKLVQRFKDTVTTKGFVDEFGAELGASLKTAMDVFTASNGESGLYIPESVQKVYPVLEAVSKKLQEIFDRSRVNYADFVKEVNAKRDEMVKNAGIGLMEKYVNTLIQEMEEIPSVYDEVLPPKEKERFIKALKEIRDTMDFSKFFTGKDLVPKGISKEYGDAYTNAKYLLDILEKIYGQENENVKRMEKAILAYEDDLLTAGRMAEQALLEPINGITEAYLAKRGKSKALEEYARNVREVFLNEAKKGMMDVVPENFTVYIDFEVANLDKQIVELTSKVESMAVANPEDTDAMMAITEQIVQLREERANLQNLLTEIYKAEAEVQGYTRRDIEMGNLEFFDNKELLENLLNIKEVENQIQAVTLAMERGRKEQEAINTLEEYNQATMANRIELERQLALATDDETKARIQAQIDTENMWLEMNEMSIDQHRATMAALGYTTEEEMQKVLQALQDQVQAFQKNTTKIMRQTAASVLQSISTITNSLVDLFNELGEDNAQMAGFLEAMAYMQIGVNMAVGLSEAIAAGAGLVWPANLAAIASGVAAVVAGIAEAISVYKQYHKNISSPKFATGGLIGGRTARTKSEGRRDDVPIMASVGEYVINHQAVKEYGVGFFDEINYGRRKKRTAGGLNFADGGYVDIKAATKAISNEEQMEMLSEVIMNMPAPVVSVKEISGMQRRVTVKENIAKNN